LGIEHWSDPGSDSRAADSAKLFLCEPLVKGCPEFGPSLYVIIFAGIRGRRSRASRPDFPPFYMTASKKALTRNGRTWTLSKVPLKDGEEEDFRFWYEGLTPEQRVDAVYDALEMCLKMKGVDAVPRLRRVHRLLKRSPR
jgi:hypothetical protein